MVFSSNVSSWEPGARGRAERVRTGTGRKRAEVVDRHPGGAAASQQFEPRCLSYQDRSPSFPLDRRPDFVSLEATSSPAADRGTERAGPELTPSRWFDALEAMLGVDLGVGATMAFGMSEHQAFAQGLGHHAGRGGNSRC